MTTVFTRILTPPPIRESEILRYAACKSQTESITALLNEVIKEAESMLSYKVCYCELPVLIEEERCDFGEIFVVSKSLAKNLVACDKVLLFGATVGIDIDRSIVKYGRLSPAKALLFQAFGAERIEALCDAFCGEYEEENEVILLPRFSAGYGDCSLEVQKDIFSLLGCSRKIGLTLNDSMLMSPSKSVTAFVGIKEKI